MRIVSGENAADWPFAASGDPHAFHRFLHGSDPSFHASRTAFDQGPISVATSFRFGLEGVVWGSALHGGKLSAWSTGKIVRVVTNAGRRKRTGRRRNAKKRRTESGRPSQRATTAHPSATAA
jgi:hypothetical protein